MRAIQSRQPFPGTLGRALPSNSSQDRGSLDEDDDESQGIPGQEKEDPEEAEAEILSSSGMAKSETGTRIFRVKKLLLKLKKEGSRDQVAILSDPLKELEKFEKKKTSMEAVKGILRGSEEVQEVSVGSEVGRLRGSSSSGALIAITCMAKIF